MPLTPFRRCFGAAALACAVAAMPSSVAAETIDRVLSVAAGELIMLSDVTAARDLGLVGPDPTAPDPIRAVLAKLIDRELVLAEVERYAPAEPAAEAIDRELQIVRARFATRQAFDAALARSGIDENHLRETLRQNLRIRAYEDQRFTVPAPSDDPDHEQKFQLAPEGGSSWAAASCAPLEGVCSILISTLLLSMALARKGLMRPVNDLAG